jgi:hypothetical protein
MQAEAWASEDTATVKQLFRIEPAQLRRAHFTFVTSPFGLNPATEQVRYYWQALLEGLGIPSSQIRFE